MAGSPIDQWLKTVPKGILVTLVLTGGILFIVLSDPPRTVCDAQLGVFKKEATPFLFEDTSAKTKRSAEFAGHWERCQSTNTPGGCYELLFQLKGLLRTTQLVSNECYGKLEGVSEMRRAVWDTLDLMVKIAWGSKPPTTYHTKFSWLDASDMNLYCQLKNLAKEVYGENTWRNFQEKYFKSLPGVEGMNRQQIWDVILLSTNCQQYL